ncbi:MAG: hypothetical protein GTO40_06145, partial [Deltaproteobacteria bacterium]|nr:hypothetical protein [Deltaproteobacteria bacterium]
MLPDDNDLLNLGIYEIAPMPCLALYTLAGCLERQGYDVTVLDAQEQTIEIDDWDLMTTSDDVSNIKQSQAVWEDLSDRIRFVSLNRVAPSYDIIGISANSFNWKITRLAVEQIRRAHPDVIIVMGGIHPTWLYR